MAFFGDPDFSDHAIATVLLHPTEFKRKKPFKFYNYMLQNPDFVQLISTEWLSINVTGSAMFRVSQKLKLLKGCIREFTKENYSDREKRVKETHLILLNDKMRCS